MTLAMQFSRFITLAAAAVSALALTPTPTLKTRADPGFITIEGDQFIRNGEPFKFIGTNAYWLASLNSEADINKTVADIASHGIKVIRTWAFNDVTEIPVNGTWFQLIANGTTSVNTGPDGLQRLDQVLAAAEANDVVVILSFTNNWNPLPLIDNTTEVIVDGLQRRDVTLGTNNSLPRNTLSNDFGGMDAYVREFGISKEHDEFYQNQTIIDIFLNYTDQVVNRYLNRTSILSYELANDPRCNSSIGASATCTTTTVTHWHSQVAQHVKSVDPNHIVSSGAHGFVCNNCTKLFPVTPRPQTSAVASVKRKRNAVIKPITNERLLAEERARRKVTRAVKNKALLERGDGLRIRGRWIATRQSDPDVSDVGPSFDGSSGVDSQDISNIPGIGFSAFQFFPDQNNYDVGGISDPNLPAINNTINVGNQWIQLQAQLAAQIGKPSVMTAFGLVSNENAPFFVPFNSTIAPFNNSVPASLNSTSILERRQDTGEASVTTFGATNGELDDAFTQWLTTAAGAGVNGAVQYQWGQGGLTTNDGSTVDANDDTSTVSANQDTSGVSPNDGYQSAAQGTDGVQSVLADLSSLFG